MFISRGVKSSIQRELDSFYKEATGSEFNIRVATKGAVSRARAKLKPEAFVELNANVNQTFYNEAPYLVWNNMRLLAIDGTRLVLPNHKSVVEEFGEHGFGPNANSNRSLALGSCLYDVLNLLTLDAQIAPYATGERELLFKHFEKINPGDLLLLDRGYPSLAILFILMAKGIQFCIRMKEDWWLSVKDFMESGEKEKIVNFQLPKKDRKQLKDYPHMFDKQIACRLVCIELENGVKEVLCTSLTDMEKFPQEDLAELYHYRWNVEESYKLFKARVEVERFSGKTVLAVKQDFFAKIFMMSLSAVLAFPIEERVKKESKEADLKHQQKINRTGAIAMLMSMSVALFLKKHVKKAIDAFDSVVSQTKEIVRPGRKNKRNIQTKKKLYNMNYKPI